MKNLLISQKFLFVAVAVSIPIVVLSYFFVADKSRYIDFARAELDGTQYLRPIRKLVADVSAHRDLAVAVAAGEAALKADLEKQRGLVDDDLKALAEAQSHHELAAPGDLQALNTDWLAIKGWVAGGSTPDEIVAMHSRYLAKLLQFGALIANESNLVLDSEVDSHYVIDALVFKLPKLDIEVGAARARGCGFIATRGQGDKAAGLRGELAGTAVRVNDALYEVNHFIRFAVGAPHPLTEQALRPSISAVNREVPAFVTVVVDKLVNASGEPMPVKDFFAAASAPIDAIGKFWDAGVEELDRLLSERVRLLQRTVQLELLAVGLAMLLTVGFLFLIARAIVKPIRHLSEIADRISLGELDVLINVESRDEIGELGERFRRMQVSLKSAMEALEHRDGG